MTKYASDRFPGSNGQTVFRGDLRSCLFRNEIINQDFLWVCYTDMKRLDDAVRRHRKKPDSYWRNQLKSENPDYESANINDPAEWSTNEVEKRYSQDALDTAKDRLYIEINPPKDLSKGGELQNLYS